MTNGISLATQARAQAAAIELPSIAVSELYGPVAQGEGARIGGPTIFLRTGGCDYRCTWCDSKYAVLPEYRNEWNKLSVEEIVAQVIELLPDGYRTGHVTLSGGNPAIQPAVTMRELVAALHEARIKVGIETQGSVLPNWLYDLNDITISPKPPSSGNATPYNDGSELEKHLKLERYLQPERTTLKIVVFDDEDYEYAVKVHEHFPDTRCYVQVGTDVGDDTPEQLIAKLSALQERILADPRMQDVQALPQLHVIISGHARGI